MWLAEVETDVARGEWIAPESDTVGEWGERWLTTLGNVRPATREGYESALRTHVIPALGGLRVDQVDRVTLRQWVAAMDRAGSSAGTIGRALVAARGTFRTAVDGGGLRIDPTVGVKPPKAQAKEMLFLDAAQVAELAEHCAGYETLVYTAAYTGARAGELVALRRANLNLLKRTMRIAESASTGGSTQRVGATKTYQARTVVLPRFLCEMLARHLEHPHDHVFPGARGGRLPYRSWYARSFRRAVIAAPSVPDGLRFHDLRHTAVALSIAQGAHPKTIAARMGHSSIAVTMDRYGHLFPSLDEELSDGLDSAYEAAAASPRPGGFDRVVEFPSK